MKSQMSYEKASKQYETLCVDFLIDLSEYHKKQPRFKISDEQGQKSMYNIYTRSFHCTYDVNVYICFHSSPKKFNVLLDVRLSSWSAAKPMLVLIQV